VQPVYFIPQPKKWAKVGGKELQSSHYEEGGCALRSLDSCLSRQGSKIQNLSRACIYCSTVRAVCYHIDCISPLSCWSERSPGSALVGRIFCVLRAILASTPVASISEPQACIGTLLTKPFGTLRASVLCIQQLLCSFADATSIWTSPTAKACTNLLRAHLSCFIASLSIAEQSLQLSTRSLATYKQKEKSTGLKSQQKTPRSPVTESLLRRCSLVRSEPFAL